MEQDEIVKHLTHLTNTVTEVLMWLQAAERNGVVPEGTLGEAQRAAELNRTMDKIKGIKETLDMLDVAPDMSALQTSLERSARMLEARANALRGLNAEA